MEERKPINIFVPGPVTAGFIGDSIQKHSSKTDIGAHSIFLGQVRADLIGEKKVKAIEYTAHEQLALKMMHEIRESAFITYELTCMHVYHSLGTVAAGGSELHGPEHGAGRISPAVAGDAVAARGAVGSRGLAERRAEASRQRGRHKVAPRIHGCGTICAAFFGGGAARGTDRILQCRAPG